MSEQEPMHVTLVEQEPVTMHTTLWHEDSVGEICTFRNRLCVVKTQDRIYEEHLLKEAMQAHVNAPNQQYLVQIFETFDTISKIFFELCDMDLARIQSINGPFNGTDTRAYCLQVAHGMHCLHSMGFIHRRITPEHIMLNGTNIKICGYSKLRSIGNDISLNGIPEFMAPEQLLHDTRVESDWWSFACLVCEMMTGIGPFQFQDTVVVGIYHIMFMEPIIPAMLPYETELFITKYFCNWRDRPNYMDTIIDPWFLQDVTHD